MPIRFRCAYCNQLMGIATRKAGTVVACPKCQGQVIVPNPLEQTESPAGSPEEKPNLFEESDLDEVFGLNPSVPEPQTLSPAPPQAAPAPRYPPPEPAGVFAAVPAPARPGIFLGPIALTVLSVVFVALVGLAFFLGLLLGRG
jgi:phage FluMu protein Com